MQRLRLALFFLIGVPLALTAEEPSSPLRVALTNFTSDDHSYHSLQVGGEFSDALATLLYATTEFEWVERQQLDRAFEEIQRGAHGLVNPAQAVRVGHWVGADLLLAGHFVADDRSRRLRLQAIDLQRADILGEATVTMTGTRRSAILFRPSEVTDALQEASKLLNVAASALEKRTRQKTIAPLFFRNTDTARRLDDLEDQFTEALEERIEADATFHQLKFPKAETARAEAEMVISGLADVDHMAWQEVADLYVWGEYREGETEKRSLDEVIVEAKLFLWDGSGDLRQITRRFPVKAQRQLLEELVDEVLGAAREATDAPPSDTARRAVARELLARESEVRQSFEVQSKEISGFRENPAATALRSYRFALLETICFFDPNNRYARWERLRLKAAGLNRWTPMLTHVTVTEEVLRWLDQYGLDEKTPANLEEAKFAFGRLASLVKHFRGQEYPYTVPHDIPWSIENAWAREWSEHFVQRVLQWRELVPVDRQNRHPMGSLFERWIRFSLEHINEGALAAAFIENLWPTYRSLLLDGSSVGFSEEELFSELRTFYRQRGQTKKAEEMLAGLEELTLQARMREQQQEIAARRARRQQSRSAEPTRSVPKRRPSPTPSERQPRKPSLASRIAGWFGSDETQERELERGLEDHRARVNAFASAREIVPRVRRIFLPLPDDSRSDPAWRVESLEVEDGNLWVRGHLLLHSALAFNSGAVEGTFRSARADASAVWTYRPIDGDAGVVWEQRAQGGLAADFSLDGDELWLALDRAGLLRKMEDGEEQLGLEEGLLSLNLFALARRDSRLYFGGGLGGKPLLGYLDLGTRQFFRVDIPEPAGHDPSGEDAGGVRNLVIGDKWLAVETSDIQFLNTNTGTWVDYPVTRKTRRPRQQWRPGHEDQRRQETSIAFDGRNFWIGNQRGLSRFHPDENTEPTEIARRPVSAVTFGGEFVWIAVPTATEGASRPMMPSSTASSPLASEDASVVAAWSPEEEQWVLRFRLDHSITSIAADTETIWLGVDDPVGPLLEVDRRTLMLEADLVSEKESPVPLEFDGADGGAALKLAAFHGAEPEIWRLMDHEEIEAGGEAMASALSIAVRRGHSRVAEILLAAGVDPNATTPQGEPVLLVATEMHRADMVGLLLSAGADPDCRRATDQLYPLLTALQGGNQGIVGMLLAFNANPNGPNRSVTEPGRPAPRFDSPLITAIERKDHSSVKVLLLHGASVNERVAGKTALSAAVVAGDVEMAATLLANGADPDQPGIGGRTPLRIATGLPDDRLFRLLLDHGADPVAPGTSGDTALGAAVARKEPDRAAELMERIGDPAGRLGDAQRGTDALARAVQQDDVLGAQRLLEAGVNPNLVPKTNGKPLLLFAIEQAASAEMLRLLVVYGADLHPLEREHREALATGSMPSHARAVLEEARELHAKAADPLLLLRQMAPWRKLNEDDILLIEAAHAGDVEHVRALLDGGANAEVRDHRGWGLLIYAIQGRHFALIEMLLERGVSLNRPTAYGSTPLGFAIEQEDVSLVTRLLQGGADPGFSLYRSPYPVHSAALKGNAEILGSLIDQGADVNPRLTDGRSPLHLAVEQQASDCVELLLKAGADIEAKDEERRRPIELAAAGGDPAILKQIIAAGANVHPENPRGATPLEHALFHGRAENAAILRAEGAQERPEPVLGRLSVRYEGNGPLPQVGDLESLRAVMEEQDFDVNAVKGATLLQQFLGFHYDDIKPALYLIERGADIHRIGGRPFNTLPIVMAVENAMPYNGRRGLADADLISLLRVMLERGADVNSRDPLMLRTPLMYAASGARPDVVEFLLQQGADPEARDIQNKRAIDMTLAAYDTGRNPAATARIRLLLGGEEL